MQTLTHPVSGAIIEGIRLAPGSVVKEGDLYDSTTGVWETGGSCVGGTVPRGDHVIWVRQPKPLSENAQALLAYLNARGGDLFGTVALWHGRYTVIPGPEFNWDGRIDLNSQQVRHPECVEELVDHGYLARGTYAMRGWHHDYSEAAPDRENRVWTLTPEGRERGKELLKKD